MHIPVLWLSFLSFSVIYGQFMTNPPPYGSRIAVIGDSVVRSLYFGLVGTMNGTLPCFSKVNQSDLCLRNGVMTQYRRLTFASDTALAIELLDGIPHDHRKHTVVILSCGLWDILHTHSEGKFFEDFTDLLLLLKQKQYPFVIIRTITPVIEKNLRTIEKRMYMNNTIIHTYNSLIRSSFLLNKETTWILHDISSLYAAYSNRSPDGVHYFLNVIGEDVVATENVLESITSYRPSLVSCEDIGVLQREGEGSGGGRGGDLFHISMSALFQQQMHFMPLGIFFSALFVVVFLICLHTFDSRHEPNLHGNGNGSGSGNGNGNGNGNDGSVEIGEDVKRLSSSDEENLSGKTELTSWWQSSQGVKIITGCRYWVLLSLILFGCWSCDIAHAIPPKNKSYSRDLFAFVCFAIASVCGTHIERSHIRTEKTVGLLNRDQTEEWRGILQVAFLLYHFYNAKEYYPFIRIFVSIYVWMTGFGHFSYFWVRAEWSVIRFVKCMFRINFLVILLVIVMGTNYVHYYICPMHTFYTVVVWGATYIGRQYNKTSMSIMMMKIFLSFVFCYLCFEVDFFFELIFGAPFIRQILSIDGSMHEWRFRAGLDRYATPFGMLFAFFHPSFEKGLRWLDHISPPLKKYGIQFIIAIFLITLLTIWYITLGSLQDKYVYNAYHPYTFFIPLVLYVFLRNLGTTFRITYLQGFAWIGKITLETYLLQFHLMLSNNNQQILDILPSYPNLNFVLVWGLLISSAFWAFRCTDVIGNLLFPYDLTTTETLIRVVMWFGIAIVWIVFGFLFQLVSSFMGLGIALILVVLFFTILSNVIYHRFQKV
jgi:N-acetylneuraminate 9-O-acetyltransferase